LPFFGSPLQFARAVEQGSIPSAVGRAERR
jgi:hypothetical protein